MTKSDGGTSPQEDEMTERELRRPTPCTFTCNLIGWRCPSCGKTGMACRTHGRHKGECRCQPPPYDPTARAPKAPTQSEIDSEPPPAGVSPTRWAAGDRD